MSKKIGKEKSVIAERIRNMKPIIDYRGLRTDYNDEMLNAARTYLLEGYLENDGVIPSVAGLACYLGVARQTVYTWKAKHPEFLEVIQGIEAKQEHIALNGGLVGKFNSAITKLVLSGHGYSDRTQTDITSSDGSMSPPKTVQFVIVDPDDDAEG